MKDDSGSRSGPSQEFREKLAQHTASAPKDRERKLTQQEKRIEELGKLRCLPDTTPMTMSEAFHLSFSDIDSRIHRYRGAWYVSDDGIYIERSTEQMSNMVLGFFAGLSNDNGKRLRLTKSTVGDILASLASHTGNYWWPQTALADIDEPFYIDGRSIDLRRQVLLANGVLDLETKKLTERTDDLFALTCSPVDYEPKAKKPSTWLAFLESIWGDDEGSKLLLQQWFAYCLTRDTSRQKILHLIGATRGGKGTIARTLGALVGNLASPSIKDLSSQFGRSSLLGKSLAFISDLRTDKYTSLAGAAETLIRVGGEDPIQIDIKHRPVLPSVRLRTRFMIASNHELPFNDVAINARLMTLRFERSFVGREDTRLESKLMEELPGILAWAIDGWASLEKSGFAKPKYQVELEQKQDPIASFVASVCAVADRATVRKQDLHKAYVEHCSNLKVSPMNEETFAKQIISRFNLKDARPRNGEERKPVWLGIGLRQ